jgi:aminopeptidase-like protein
MSASGGPRAPESVGADLHALAARLYPIPRSITGDGVRASLRILAERIPLALHEIPSGTAVFDWTVPKEWVVRSARLTAPDGRVIADVDRHSLELLNYSAPFRGRLPLAELRKHLFSLPEHPDLVPYRTSYYEERWGFCLPHAVVESIPDGEYEVAIDTALVDGGLTWGEVVLPGDSAEEILFSTHCCHPSLANDNLSGMVVATALAARLAALPRRRHSYRFLFLPGTIGAIAWLATHPEERRRIRCGLVLAGLGAPGPFHYKRSRHGAATIDRELPRALARAGEPLVVEEFVPFGYDERQYNSPGIALPVGCFSRTPYGRYPEYHTSADDLDFIRPETLEGSLRALIAVVDRLETREVYRNLAPHAEPQLGRRGLYRTVGGDDTGRERELALLWVLNLSDGDHALEEIAERSGLGLERIRDAARRLVEVALLAPVA